MSKLYLIFYCMVKNDGTNSVYSRTVYLIEIFLTLVFISLSEVIIGLSNLRLGIFFHWILIMLPSPIFAYLLIKNNLSEIKGKDIVQKFSEQISKRRVCFSLLAIGLFIGAFIMLIACGVLMSYLLSLYE